MREGWAYLPIYVGPALVYLPALPFLERLVEVGRANKVGSIADFIASRFGKSRSLAVLVTVIADALRLIGAEAIDAVLADYHLDESCNGLELLHRLEQVRGHRCAAANDSAVHNMEWFGARYALSSGWNFTGALYHIVQNSWTIGLGPSAFNNIGCTDAGLLCSGSFKEASFAAADYIITKHYDVYGGVNWSEVTDGLANGFPGTSSAPNGGTYGSENQTTFMFGIRIKI